MRKNEIEWHKILTDLGVCAGTAMHWAPVFASVIDDDTFSAGVADLAPFLGQILHESGKLEHVEENLNYSAERLTKVWPARFPTVGIARVCERNPQALGNKVYGGRMGNNMDGDGYKFRGRGLLQVTGRDNYRLVGKAIGLDLETYPDSLCHPEVALRSAIAWWEKKIPDGVLGDVMRVTKLVNGGTNGLDDRAQLTELAMEALA